MQFTNYYKYQILRLGTFGTPGRIRTYDLLLRRQTLYPG
jgi:hypothetical protein